MNNHPLYRTWSRMKQRCESPTDAAYKRYGGRGIRVCDRWSTSFSVFARDMGERPEGMTLERIDNSGNYEPDNCCWATRQAQANNRRSNVIIETPDGPMTLAQAARVAGLTYSGMARRIRIGVSAEDILQPPIQGRRLSTTS